MYGKSCNETRQQERKNSPYYKDWRVLSKKDLPNTAPMRALRVDRPVHKPAVVRRDPVQAPLEWWVPSRDGGRRHLLEDDRIRALHELLELAKSGPK